jgi:predicted dehydrogenase
MLKIAFAGIGSISSRHIRNLSEILSEERIAYQIDAIRSSRERQLNPELKALIRDEYYSNVDVPDDYDIIFVTNPTFLHYQTIKVLGPKTRHMFIEKPLFDSVDLDISALELKHDSIYYVACPLRYNAVLQYVRENIDLSKVFSIRAISSSYLPDWRPGKDYRETYSAHKDMGGGVGIDLIHEWDYLTLFFGFPEIISTVTGKYSGLEIDSDDLAVYIGYYPDKVIELHLDYFGRNTIRRLEMFTDDETILADIFNGYVLYEKSGKKIDLNEDRDVFQKRELRHFLDMVSGKATNDNSIENAFKVLKIAMNRG